jgi:predicted ATPase
MAGSGARYLQRVSLVEARVPDFGEFPYSLPIVRDLSLTFAKAVTSFVGENGSGKSTLIEAIAEICGLPVSGGGKSELADGRGPEAKSALGGALRPSFAKKPRDAYFFRAELQSHFASLLEQRREDPDFRGDPYAVYGGRSLHKRWHSPILLTFPGADIVSIDQVPPVSVALADTSHYQITRGILESPERYWKHLRKSASDDDEPE